MRIALLHEVRIEPGPGQPTDLYLEFERLETIQLTAHALEALGHSVVLVDSMDEPVRRLQQLRGEIDLVFNISVGFGSRFRELMPAAMCESLGLRYTGSDPMAQALAANKHATKLLAHNVGIATPQWCFVQESSETECVFAMPVDRVIVKPNYEGTSIGITGPLPVDRRDDIAKAIDRVLRDYHQPALVEAFIAGYDATVPIVGNPGVPIAALRLATGASIERDVTFDSTAKEDTESPWFWTTDHPAAIGDKLAADALRLHNVLGCRDLSRVDFRVDDEGSSYLLEINATPQLAPRGGAFEAALRKPFAQVLETVIQTALAR